MTRKKNSTAVAETPKKNGRPLLIPTPERFQELADAYFIECDVKKIPYTITGLAVFCGTYRQRLAEYEKREEFRDVVKRAKARVEESVEIRALIARNPAGAIFVLKNLGWSDKQEVEHTGDREFTFIVQGLYGQPGDIPLPAGAVIVQPGNGDSGGRAAALAAGKDKGNGDGDGNGNR